MIYISLLTVSFMVATLVPFGSEMYFATLLSLGSQLEESAPWIQRIPDII